MKTIETLVRSGTRTAVFLATLSATASLLTAAAPASAHDYKAGSLHIEHPWARATPPKAGVAGAYMVIENTGSKPDRLLGGTTEAAARIEIHSMTMEGDVMKMRQLSDGLEIPAGETVTLAPGGVHLMLIDPSEPLKEGTRVPATLRFEKAGTVQVELAVDGMGAKGPGAMEGMHHGGPAAANGAAPEAADHGAHEGGHAK